MEKVEKIISLLENGRHKEAMKSYKFILHSGSSEERFVLGEELFRHGFLEEAKALFEKLLQIYPEEGELHRFICRSLSGTWRRGPGNVDFERNS